MKSMGLDLSLSSTGLVVIDYDEKENKLTGYSSKIFSTPKGYYIDRIMRLRDLVLLECRGQKLLSEKLIVNIEDISFGFRYRSSTFQLAGLIAVVEIALKDEGFIVNRYGVSTIRSKLLKGVKIEKGQGKRLVQDKVDEMLELDSGGLGKEDLYDAFAVAYCGILKNIENKLGG